MKRKIYQKLALLLTVLVVVLASASCKDNVNLTLYVSELRSGIYYGEGDNLTLTAYVEEREEPFIIDGFVGEIKKVITVKLSSENRVINSASVKLKFDGYECEGDFEYSLLSGKFTAEIIVDKLPEGPIVEAVFKCGEEEVSVQLKTKITSGNITYKEALESVKKYDSKTTDELFNNTSVSTEIHIRIISDNLKNYYYVGFATKSGDIYAYLVDGATGEVLAKKST